MPEEKVLKTKNKGVMKMHMQKRLLSLVLAFLLLFSLALPAGAVEISSYSAAGTMTELAGGSKTAAGNYSISTAAELTLRRLLDSMTRTIPPRLIPLWEASTAAGMR